MTVSADTRPAIDEQWLTRMRTTKPDFLRRLFEVFLSEEPKRITALTEAVTAADLEKVRFLAHSMKGASATMGMERLRDACRALELAAKEGEMSVLADKLKPVTREMECVLTLIRQVMASV